MLRRTPRATRPSARRTASDLLAPTAGPAARSRRTAGAAVLAAALLATSVAASPASSAPAAPAEEERVTATAVAAEVALVGHGWGHGRGLGQFGSLGYATGTGDTGGARLDYRQILDHFYGGTTVGHINDNPLMAVLLKARSGQPMVVYRETGLQVTGLAGAPTAVRVTLRADGQFDVQTGASCTDPFAAPPVPVPGPVRVTTAPDSGTLALRLCNGDGSAVAYRGELVAMGTDFAGQKPGAEVVNLVQMDELLRGVVPRESPASWGDAAGGSGLHALRAQAVAARSYAAAGDNRWGDRHSGLGARATTCDDQFCQVYGGAATISPTGAVTLLTHANTDKAVGDTAGEVRMAGGQVARTEFSSSTGGWTAGGTFPAVQDLGDSTPSNPNHTWSTSVPRSAIESRFDVGTLTAIEIVERNGLGDQGGRVKTVRLTGTAGTDEISGNELRSALTAHGVKSDWFDVIPSTVPTVEPRSIDAACPPGTVPPSGFTDVPPTSVHRRAIDCLADRDITAGSAIPGQFAPTGDVTRGQMATFVTRLIADAGRPLPPGPDAFSDDETNVHEANINALAASGITTGTADPSRFAPDEPVTRAQVSTFVARAYAHLAGSPLTAGPDAFSDDDHTSAHEANINALAAVGVASGIGPGTFAPDRAVRRDQMASLLARTLALLVDQGVTT